jgi:hypothetical protein
MSPEPECKTCNTCLLHDKIIGTSIGENGICNYCTTYKTFIPYGESNLMRIFQKAQKKKRIYDALVPLSGGKDSTYVLYLAVRKYKLKVLSYTYDNGFMSGLAKMNINKTIKECGVDHVWIKHDEKLIQEFYKTALVHSGELCGICGVGIERSMLKISEAWKIPLILLGHSPTESNSFTSEDIYDQNKLKAILKQNSGISSEMINRFLVYPHLNFITSYFHTLTGRFGKKLNILYYLNIPSDKEIGAVLSNELGWKEPEDMEYTRHFDCIAEPFTNYIREKRFGNSRRLPQLSNMIRNNEVTRGDALKIHSADQKKNSSDKFENVLSALNLTMTDVEEIVRIPANVFSNKKSAANLVFAKARRLIKRSTH